MKKMIFEPVISGHVLEWLHHLYEHVSFLQDEFVFVLPQKFENKKKMLSWKENKVKIIYLSSEEEVKCTGNNLLKNAWNASWIVRKYAKQENVSEVFLIFLMKLMPFLIFVLPWKCGVSGVIYRIYLYDSTKKGLRLFLEKIRYFLMAKSTKVNNIFLLNDKMGASIFNKIYHCKKFKYLTDPLPEISGPFHNLRENLNIPKANKIFFQFGSIDERKHSLEILEAIKLMKLDELSNKTFIFSGKISSSIRTKFFKEVNSLKESVQIIVIEGFLTYETLNDLCFTSDCILTLYKNVCQSSGSIGYAAFFNKYVISPSSGLLGNLVKEYNLGILLDSISPKTIKESLCANYNGRKTNYCSDHTVEYFCKAILK